MRVCHVVASLEERHGGPSKSVYALAGALGRIGNEVDLCTLHARTPREHAEDSRFRVHSFPRAFPHALARSSTLAAQLATLDCEVVHNHALWLRPLHYAHQHAEKRRVPLINSPRGMMSPWAWQHHRLRKQFARRFIHPRALEATAGWHATSQEEAQDIRALGFTQPICVAPNGVEAPDPNEVAAAEAHWRKICPDVSTRPTAVFYSRFHRKKRVLELIDTWVTQAPSDWLLLLVGIPEEYSVHQLESYILRASGSGRIRVFDGRRQPPPYAVASLFLLPSHNENFGLSIAEAMAHGVPILVTDTTPWNAIESVGGGWCVPWSSYSLYLEAALREDVSSLQARGQTAREWVLREYSWERSARLLQDFYRQLTSPAGS